MGETISDADLKHPAADDPDADRAAWIGLLGELVRKVKAWSGDEWAKKDISKPMRDPVLGRYKAPGLLMQCEFTQVILEPVARYAPGCDGVVDLAKMPAYDRVASLYRIDDEWKLHYAFKGSSFIAKPRTAQSLLFDESLLRKVLGEFISDAE